MIVDPQIDFIDGALAVTGAQTAIEGLVEYIGSHRDYALVIITADRHPSDHCSFKDNGGMWPAHCTGGSDGARIKPELLAAVEAYPADTLIMGKGRHSDQEEYSVFSRKENCDIISSLVDKLGITGIDICGLAGDFCVLSTLADGIELFGHAFFRVLLPFTPSIDGGRRLEEFILSNNIRCVRL